MKQSEFSRTTGLYCKSAWLSFEQTYATVHFHASCSSQALQQQRALCRLIIFGGRSADRKRLNDVHFLDIATWTWHRPNTDGTPPTPRLGAAAVFMGGQMILFGGYGAGARLNDLHTLDLTSWQWQQPGLTGTAPSPRQSSGIALQGQCLQSHTSRCCVLRTGWSACPDHDDSADC